MLAFLSVDARNRKTEDRGLARYNLQRCGIYDSGTAQRDIRRVDRAMTEVQPESARNPYDP